jgi:hypothetical protein
MKWKIKYCATPTNYNTSVTTEVDDLNSALTWSSEWTKDELALKGRSPYDFVVEEVWEEWATEKRVHYNGTRLPRHISQELAGLIKRPLKVILVK